MSVNPPGTGQRPRLRPTSPATLVVVALVTAAIGWLFIANDYGDFPRVTWLPAIITGGLGALEIIAALATKARIDQRPGALPVDPLTVVRYVVLAKASSIVGALFAGFFGGISIWLFASRGRLAAAVSDLPPAVGGFLGAVLLLVGALLLERACRVPPPPDDEEQTS